MAIVPLPLPPDAEARALLHHLLEHGDVVGRDSAGRTIIRLVVDDWVYEKLMTFDADAAELGDQSTPSPTTMPRRTCCQSCCSMRCGRRSSGAGGPWPWFPVRSIEPWRVGRPYSSRARKARAEHPAGPARHRVPDRRAAPGDALHPTRRPLGRPARADPRPGPAGHGDTRVTWSAFG